MTNIPLAGKIKVGSEFISELLAKDSKLLSSLIITELKELGEAKSLVERLLVESNDERTVQAKKLLDEILISRIELTHEILKDSVGIISGKPTLISKDGTQLTLDFRKTEKENEEDRSIEVKDEGKIIKVDFRKNTVPTEDLVDIKENPLLRAGRKTFDLKDNVSIVFNRFKVIENGKILPRFPEEAEAMFNKGVTSESQVDEICYSIFKHTIDQPFKMNDLGVNFSIDAFCVEGVGTIPKKDAGEVIRRYFLEIVPWMSKRYEDELKIEHPRDEEIKPEPKAIPLPETTKVVSKGTWPNDPDAKPTLLELEKEVVRLFKERDWKSAYATAQHYLESASEEMEGQAADFNQESIKILTDIWRKKALEETQTVKTKEMINFSDFKARLEKEIESRIKEGDSKLYNAAMKLWSQYKGSIVMEGGKKFEVKDLVALYRDIIEAVKRKVEGQSDKRMFKRFSVKENYPAFYEEAQKKIEGGKFGNFAALLTKTVRVDNDWLKAINLALDVIPNNTIQGWEFCKGWTEDMVHSWFNKNILKLRVELSPNEDFDKQKEEIPAQDSQEEPISAVKEAIVSTETVPENKPEPTETVETTEEVADSPDEDEARLIKYKEEVFGLLREKMEKSRYKYLCAKFLGLKNYKTLSERIQELIDEYVMKNPKWAKHPRTEAERFVMAVVRNNKELQELALQEKFNFEDCPF